MGDDGIAKGLTNFFKWLGPIMVGVLLLVSIIIGVAFINLPYEKSKSILDLIDASGSIIGATLGSFFAFLSIVFVVYSLQYQTHEKKWDQEELDKNRLIYFYSLLKQSVAFLEETITGLRNRKTAYKDDRLNFHGMTIGVANSLHRISNIINQEEYYLAYKKAFNDETINEIFNKIDAIDFNFKVLKSDIQMEQDLYNKRKDEFNKHIKELKFLIINIIQGKRRYLSDTELKNNTAVIEYYDRIEKFKLDLVNFEQNGISETAKYLEKHALVEKLYLLIGNYQNEDYSNSLGKVERLQEDLLRAINLFFEIDSGAKTVSEKIDEALQEYQKYLTQISGYIKPYEERYFKKYGDSIDK